MKKIEITHELGDTFWVGISFAAGCFTNNWVPFSVVLVLVIFRSILKIKDS